MPSLLVTLNEQPMLHAGTDACTSLSWDVRCCRHDQHAGYLSIQGMITRPDGNYDHPHWLEDYALSVGDILRFTCSEEIGTSPIKRLHTHEQLEELRIQVNAVEAAGEYDAVRAASRPILRASATLELTPNGHETCSAAATGNVMTAICSGIWSTDIRREEWRLRVWAMPTSETASGFWAPISGGAQVAVQA